MPRKTEAAVLFELGQPLRIITLTIPELKPGQVLVEVAYSRVCHSQLLEVRGKRGHDRFLPHTLGHEGSGTVLEVGAGVTKVKSGDHVVLSWIKFSESDVPSTVYQSSERPINSGAISTFMRQTVTCENRVIPINSAMPLRQAALLGCAIPTGAGIVFNSAGIQAGDSVAIFGVGGIGLSAVLAADLAQAVPIIAIDLFDLIRGKRIIGSWGGETRPDRDIPMYADLYLSGKLKLDRLATHSCGLDDINTALENLENGRVGRAMIDMSLGMKNE